MVDEKKDAIPFEVFASFKRIESGNPIISLPSLLLGGSNPRYHS